MSYVYVERKHPNADQVYLNEASAAILWKHPVFSGTAKDRQRQPSVKLVDYRPTYSRASNRITLAGKLVSDMPAHSVFVIDDLGKPEDEYWFRSHVGRMAADGTFRVAIDQPGGQTGSSGCSFASTTAWSPATARASSSTTVARSTRRTAFATGATASKADPDHDREHPSATWARDRANH